jgi:hypothetical protein
MGPAGAEGSEGQDGSNFYVRILRYTDTEGLLGEKISMG